MDLIQENDRWLFNAGNHYRLYEVLGAQPDPGGAGYRFGVWAPEARSVWVVGDFNGWQTRQADRLMPQATSGIWAGINADASIGDRYKYRIETADGRLVERADPLAFAAELPPATASVITDLTHAWTDQRWMAERPVTQAWDKPLSIYEMHVGSWRHSDAYRSLNWNELADPLCDHLAATGFTHVELMPITEHPFYGSWGYQTTGYFAPTARYGLPTEFMGFVDRLHERGFGVILDWVPSHFPADDAGLGNFDGSHCYEYSNPAEGWHPDWKSYIFNYGRHEVRSFLISSAMMWIDRYHIDGIRVDAVASMLYRDYSRNEGEWVPNHLGGRENLEAVGFLRQFNEAVGAENPDVITVAEESTAWPGVSRSTEHGGLGFHYKWDMGWMHDTLRYLERDPIHRHFHHEEITFRAVYAFTENYVLPLSHDEVTHGKGSLLAKMPGDEWQQFANLRVLYGMQWTQPGKKLLFMGQEFAQGPEWNHDYPLPWGLRDHPLHAGTEAWVTECNRLYGAEPALHERDLSPEGFEWLVLDDGENSVLAYLRRGSGDARPVLVIVNMTPVVRWDYRVGVPNAGQWEVLTNSDEARFGGSANPVVETLSTESHGAHGRPFSLVTALPPLSVLVFAPMRETTPN